MSATIRELARRVGLSVSTVSKALNGYPDVNEETCARVMRVAQEMNYIPNAHARAMRSRRNYNLGVLFTDGSHSGLTHPFFSAVLEGFRSGAEEQGYDITFIGHRLGKDGVTSLDHCRARELEGVCVACVDFEAKDVLELVESEMPLVTIDRLFPGRGSVLADNRSGMTQLVNYVADQGFRKIAFIHGTRSWVTEIRVQTFLKEMKGRGLEVPEGYLAESEYTNPQSCYERAVSLLERPDPPECILVCDDFSSTGAMSAALQMGLRVPEDLSLAGYDGLGIMQNYYPRITTVDQDADRIGREAAKLLIAQVEGGEPQTRIVPSRLIRGESVRRRG